MVIWNYVTNQKTIIGTCRDGGLAVSPDGKYIATRGRGTKLLRASDLSLVWEDNIQYVLVMCTTHTQFSVTYDFIFDDSSKQLFGYGRFYPEKEDRSYTLCIDDAENCTQVFGQLGPFAMRQTKLLALTNFKAIISANYFTTINIDNYKIETIFDTNSSLKECLVGLLKLMINRYGIRKVSGSSPQWYILLK